MRPRNRILLSTVIGYVSRLFSALVGLIVIPFLISRLGVARYGIIGVLQSLLQLSTLVDMGLRPAALRQITYWRATGRDERAGEIASTTFTIYAVLAVALVGASVLLGQWGLPRLQIPMWGPQHHHLQPGIAISPRTAPNTAPSRTRAGWRDGPGRQDR